MKVARALARLDRRVLRAYSARAVHALRARLPLGVSVPPLERFLERNVEKEIAKDALVIGASAASHTAGADLDTDAYAALLASARAIDRRFLDQAAGFPVAIHVPYSEIEPVRRQRMQRISIMTVALCRQMVTGERGLRDALRAAWPKRDFEDVLREILELYAQEVMALSRSIDLPGPLALLRETIARRLLGVMREAADAVCADAVRTVYRSSRGPRFDPSRSG